MKLPPWLSLLLVVGAFMATGCQALRPEPFISYRAAVSKMQTGTEQALSLDYRWAREAFIDRLISRDDSSISSLIIDTGEGYQWSLPSTNLPMLIKKTGAAASRLSAVFLAYADLLADLAGAGKDSAKRFENLAVGLNRKARAAASAIQEAAAMNGQSLPIPQGDLVWFGLGTSEVLRLMETRQRRQTLRRVLKKNQPAVEAYAQSGGRLIRILTVTLKKTYHDRAAFLRDQWNDTARGGRRPVVEALLALDDDFIESLSLLEEWERAYKLLPAAHAALGRALTGESSAPAAFAELFESGLRLERLYDRLRKE